MQSNPNFMKLATIIFCSLTLIPFGKIQAQLCTPATSQIDISTDRVQVRNLVAGSLWWDGTGEGRFLVDDPELSSQPTSAALAAGLWLGGLDEGNNLKLACQTYGLSSGQTDFWPGPLSDNGIPIPNACENFDKIWEVKKEDLDAHIADYEDNGMIDNPIIHPSIKSWPGKDNPLSLANNGFELPAGRDLAPFFDVNNDNKYNPEDGDYPDTRNADVAQWWIFNDNSNIHSETNGDPIKAEIAVLSYTFDDDQVNQNSTIFYELEITNRALEAIKGFYVGLWVDPQLGCYEDDYIGCSPEDDLAFVYNSDSEDGDANNNCAGGGATFDNGIPLFGIKILEGVKDADGVAQGMTSFTYYNNNGVGGPWPAGTVDPSSAFQYYPYLDGRWGAGTPFTIGGSGHDPYGDATRFVFPDDPSDPTGWSQCTAGSAEGDRRFIISSGTTTLLPGEKTNVSYAAIVTGAVEHPCPDISPLIEAANDAQDAYDARLTKNKNILLATELTIHPNPTNDIVNIQNSENEVIESLTLTTVDGKIINHFTDLNDSNYQLDLSNQAAGIYILNIKTENGKVGNNKVVKY